MNEEITVENFIETHENWRQELLTLKNLVALHDLKECIKWGSTVYTYNEKNVVGLSAFKHYVGLWFFQGGLLKDKAKKLVNAQEGKTIAMRQWRFYSLEEILTNESQIIAYLEESMANVKAGKEIKPKVGKPLIIPQELLSIFKKNPEIKEAFQSLNLNKKREFVEYIETAKQEKTKQQRLEKIIPMILSGIGLNDKYQ